MQPGMYDTFVDITIPEAETRGGGTMRGRRALTAEVACDTSVQVTVELL